MITERLLHFIWQFQYFNKSGLVTTNGEPLQVLIAGNYNTNQGPDFLNARIRIQKTIWAGNIELHIKTSDWIKHKHKGDTNYHNVILHVVWENNLKPGETNDNLPVLELKDRVSKILLQRYRELMKKASFIPCENMIGSVQQIIWQSWKDRLLAERLMRKTKVIEQYLTQNNHHWEETFWWLLAKNFGVKVNAMAFEEMAQSIPVKILAKHKTQLQQLEALLFGQAGLLNEQIKADDYYILLQREYKFLKEKYGLQPIHRPVHFLRMRPGNFPTVRLAQLAALIQHSSHLFSTIKETEDIQSIKSLFNQTTHDYWHYHYRFGEKSAYKVKKVGVNMVDNIIINTICPILFAYGSFHKQEKYKRKALNWLETTKAESNHITRGFIKLGVRNNNAFDSQALLELKNEYCSRKRCLECGIGNAILKN